MAPDGNARRVHTCVNDLIKSTILDIENILNRLPQRGDRVEVVKSGKGESNLNEINFSSRKNKTTSDSSVERCSTCGPSTYSTSRASRSSRKECQPLKVNEPKVKESVQNEQPCKKALPKAKGRIVPDSICVTPLDVDYGMMIDMMLSVKIEQTNETKLMKIQVECPNFKPSRLNIGGKWYDVVDDDTKAHN